jgi:hypothetical protein
MEKVITDNKLEAMEAILGGLHATVADAVRRARESILLLDLSDVDPDEFYREVWLMPNLVENSAPALRAARPADETLAAFLADAEMLSRDLDTERSGRVSEAGSGQPIHPNRRAHSSAHSSAGRR